MMLFSLRACLSDRPSGAGCVEGLSMLIVCVSVGERRGWLTLIRFHDFSLPHSFGEHICTLKNEILFATGLIREE